MPPRYHAKYGEYEITSERIKAIAPNQILTTSDRYSCFMRDNDAVGFATGVTN
jgi:hypothetical protein